MFTTLVDAIEAKKLTNAVSSAFATGGADAVIELLCWNGITITAVSYNEQKLKAADLAAYCEMSAKYATEKFHAFSARASDIAANQGAASTTRAIRMCYDAKISATKAGQIIATAMHSYAGEAVYQYIARALAPVTK
jgi:hypothetical protein